MASAGEEGRSELRKCPGIGKREMIRTHPNGATPRAGGPGPGAILGRTRGTETSQYPEEEKENIDSPSSGERRGKSLNRRAFGRGGVVGPAAWAARANRKAFGKRRRRG